MVFQGRPQGLCINGGLDSGAPFMRTKVAPRLLHSPGSCLEIVVKNARPAPASDTRSSRVNSNNTVASAKCG